MSFIYDIKTGKSHYVPYNGGVINGTHIVSPIAAVNSPQKTKKPVIYCCGPYPMARKTAFTAKKYGLECQVSLEALMACGTGACLGCAVAVRGNSKTIYKTACKDGPVFNAEEIIWQRQR